MEYYNDGSYLDFDIVCADSTGQIPMTGQAGNISVSLYDSQLNPDAATITITEIGATGYYRIRTTYTDVNLGVGDGLWRWKFTNSSPDFTFIPSVVTLKLPASIGSDSPGVTTLLSRIASVVTITGGKLDINDKTGFSLTSNQTGVTIGVVNVLAGHTAQTGDSYPIVAHASYGNAKLVRSTTPANTLDVSSTGEVGLDFSNIKDATLSHTLTNITVPVVTDVSTKTGYSLSGTQTFNLTGNIIGNITGNISGSVGSLTTNNDKTGYAIGSGGITSLSFAASAIDAASVAVDTSAEIADTLLNRNISGGSSTGRTVREALWFLRNKWSTSGGTLTVYQTDDVTSGWTAVITTTAGNPVSTIDPA